MKKYMVNVETKMQGFCVTSIQVEAENLAEAKHRAKLVLMKSPPEVDIVGTHEVTDTPTELYSKGEEVYCVTKYSAHKCKVKEVRIEGGLPVYILQKGIVTSAGPALAHEVSKTYWSVTATSLPVAKPVGSVTYFIDREDAVDHLMDGLEELYALVDDTREYSVAVDTLRGPAQGDVAAVLDKKVYCICKQALLE